MTTTAPPDQGSTRRPRPHRRRRRPRRRLDHRPGPPALRRRRPRPRPRPASFHLVGAGDHDERHALTDLPYCNVTEWMDNAGLDDAARCTATFEIGRTPVEVFWEGDGYAWSPLRTTVTICGSTRFRDEMTAANRRLTLAGHIVLAPGVFVHDGDTITDTQKQNLDQLHLAKIDASEWVYVVNPAGTWASRHAARSTTRARAASQFGTSSSPGRSRTAMPGAYESGPPMEGELTQALNLEAIATRCGPTRSTASISRCRITVTWPEPAAAGA